MTTAATDEQRQTILSTLAAVALPEHDYRGMLYVALYELACKGVIPPEIRLDVRVRRSDSGAWQYSFGDDLADWLGLAKCDD